MLGLVPEHLKTQEVCNEAVQSDPGTLKYVPDHLKTQEMCNEAVQGDPWALKYVSDHLKTQEMCIEAADGDAYSLQDVPDFWVTQDLIQAWRDDISNCDSAEVIEWYNGYKQRKTQKAKIESELMPVAWHSDRWWDWCVPEDEKKELEKYFA